MNRVHHFELQSLTAARFCADANCTIRVTSGRVWLTMEGHSHDAWLSAGASGAVGETVRATAQRAEHAVPRGTVVWLSAEPVATIAVVYAPIKARPFHHWFAVFTRYAPAPLLRLRRNN